MKDAACSAGSPPAVAWGSAPHRLTDHGPYIAAVRDSIQAQDIRVPAVSITTTQGGRRTATLTLRPDQDVHLPQVPAEAHARWDEDAGWSMLAHREGMASVVWKGLDVLPAPQDVAAWAVVLLAHPELTPSYGDQPCRGRRDGESGFEARLARYATGS